jgi:hypothetical protein
VLRLDRTWWWAVASGAAFGASMLARISDLFVSLSLLIAVIGIASHVNRTSWARTLRTGIAFCAPVAAAMVVMLMFNDARFGNVLET